MTILATEAPREGEESLGWEQTMTPAEINERLARALDALGPNDKLMFRRKYDFGGPQIHNTRSSLNIGAAQGAGLHLVDPTAPGQSYFKFGGNNVKISNLTITSEGVNGSGFNQGKELFHIDGTGFVFEWGRVDCDLGAIFQFNGGADRGTIQGSEFSNLSGWNSGRSTNNFICPVVAIGAPNVGFVYRNNYVHQWPHEHIKTGVRNTDGVMLVTIEDNFLENIGRDIADSTGGLSGTSPSARSIIRGNTIIGCATILDAKFEGQTPDSYPIGRSCTKFVLIERNRLYRATNFLVSTLTNKAQMLSVQPGPQFWRDAIPEDILCLDNEVQDVKRMGLIKAGLDIVVEGTRRRGSVGDVRIFRHDELAASINGAADVAAAIYAHVGGDVSGFFRETGSMTLEAEPVPTGPSFACGPRAEPAEPTMPPLPPEEPEEPPAPPPIDHPETVEGRFRVRQGDRTLVTCYGDRDKAFAAALAATLAGATEAPTLLQEWHPERWRYETVPAV